MKNLIELDKALYTGIKITVKSHKVTDADIEKQIQAICSKHVHMEEKDGIAVKGDVANIDYEGFKEGVPFKGGKGQGYNLELGSGTFIPGFETQLMGHKKGDEVDVKLSFPANYPEKTLAGQPVVFKVKINAVNTKVVPKFDDEFAKTMGEADAVSLRNAISGEMTKYYKFQDQKVQRAQLLKTVVQNAKVQATEAMIQETTEEIKAEMEIRLKLHNQTLENFLRAQRMTPDMFEKQLHTQGTQAAPVRVILCTIASQEGMTASQEELDRFFEGLAAESKKTADEIRAIFPEELAADNISMDKANRFIAEHAVIEEA